MVSSPSLLFASLSHYFPSFNGALQYNIFHAVILCSNGELTVPCQASTNKKHKGFYCYLSASSGMSL